MGSRIDQLLAELCEELREKNDTSPAELWVGLWVGQHRFQFRETPQGWVLRGPAGEVLYGSRGEAIRAAHEHAG